MPTLLTLRCSVCHRPTALDRRQVQQRLRELGFLRREGEPSDELLLEVARSLLPLRKLAACEHCGVASLSEGTSTDADDDSVSWPGEVRSCERCSATIPPERLELYPTAKLCAACQSKGASSPATEHEYCPRCGDHLQLRATPGRSAEYRMYCPACRKAF
jgi:predicted RNA-binding Zn-ribbon protein involved in translation (DUF1610 family)